MSGEPSASEHLIREAGPLRVLQAVGGGDGPFNPDGTVNIVIIRPGKGRGPGDRIFQAAHLERDCRDGTFVGWPMYDNHESPLARRARAGLPRPPSELAGAVRETWWDPNYEDEKLDREFGFAKGAVCARVMPTEPMEALIRRIPEAVKVSVNGVAKKLTKGQWNGADGWVVEGFVNDPEDSSIDFVTRAGAGGDVRRVLEACNDPAHERRDPTREEEEDVNLQEALSSDEFRGVLQAEIKDFLEEGGYVPADEVDKRVAEAVSEQLGVRDLRDHARERIRSAKGLTDTARADLLERFDATDNGAGVLEAAGELRVAAEERDGQVVKTATQVLDDKLDAAFKRERDKVSEAAPTVPSGQGVSNGSEVPSGETVHSPEAPWVQQARRAGVDVEKVYRIKMPEGAK
jgi:hypothetical protein